MKVLIVLTSHDQLGDTGRKTGFWLEELAAPYYVLKEAGYAITLASPKGGQPPLDPKSAEPNFQTDATRRFDADAEAGRALANTVKLADVSEQDYDTVFYPGGHGPLWDLAESADSSALIESFLAANKPVALVCHAPGVLRHVKTPEGRPLVEGKQVTGFTNTEEEGVGLTDAPGAGRVDLGLAKVHTEIARDDVAATIVELLRTPGLNRLILELTGGGVPIREAVGAMAVD